MWGDKLAKFNAVGFSIGIVIGLATIFIFAICGILYFLWGDQTAIKDSLSTAASIFGGFATLGAAIIAAYLYTDWKEPHLFLKIASEQKEIVVITRRMKRNVDAFNLFMATKKPHYLGLNNGDEFANEYQKLANNILDDIDDLAGLLKAYKFNFKSSISYENKHMSEIDNTVNSLTTLFNVFSKPDPILGFNESYPKLVQKVKSGELKILYEEILIALPDNLFKYHASITRKD